MINNIDNGDVSFEPGNVRSRSGNLFERGIRMTLLDRDADRQRVLETV